MANKKSTSSSVASTASRMLSNPNASVKSKSIAASALSQVNKGKQTSKTLETLASKMLDNPNSSTATKKIAASVLSQSNK